MVELKNQKVLFVNNIVINMDKLDAIKSILQKHDYLVYFIINGIKFDTNLNKEDVEKVNKIFEEYLYKEVY